jgi:hypothetical protein
MPASMMSRAAFFIIDLPHQWMDISILLDYGFFQELR